MALSNRETFSIPPAVWEYVEVLLHDRPVIPVAEFDRAVAALCVEPAADAPMERRGKAVGRKRSENLADWVKATLTRRGRTLYVTHGGIRFLVGLPPAVALVEPGGHREFWDVDRALRVIRAVAAEFTGKRNG